MLTKFYVSDDVDALSEIFGKRILEIVQKSDPNKTSFSVALSGGSFPTILGNALKPYLNEIDFSKWHFFLADERYVPNDHPDSNFKASLDAFLKQIPQAHLHPIDPSVDLSKCAEKYQELLLQHLERNQQGIPVFDIIFLGLGPDGHTASLFPGHPLLDEKNLFVAPISDSPKPPPQRITLTYPVLDAAKHVIFVATGASKEDIMPQVLINDEILKSLGKDALPAARVRPTSGSLEWYIDVAAAAKL